MLSGDKNVSFRYIIWTKEIFFRQSDTCPFLTKGELVYENPLKRSVLISQFQNSRNLDEKDFFTRFTQKQLPIHDRTKNRLITLSLFNYGKEYHFQLNDILSHNPDEKTQSL